LASATGDDSWDGPRRDCRGHPSHRRRTRAGGGRASPPPTSAVGRRPDLSLLAPATGNGPSPDPARCLPAESPNAPRSTVPRPDHTGWPPAGSSRDDESGWPPDEPERRDTTRLQGP